MQIWVKPRKGYHTMTDLDDLLAQHGLTRDTATAYIDAIIRQNQTETADTLDVSRQTINRYKQAFQELSAEERAFIIASLLDERWRELVRNDR